MQLITKNSLKTIASLTFILLLNGCVTKNADGSYPKSVYSFHYANKIKMANHQQTEKFHNPQMRSSTLDKTYNKLPTYPKMSQNTTMLNQHIIQFALSMLGTPYKYGANGPYEYDCSSFTQLVFLKHGIFIPRVSRDQAKVGQEISRDNLQTGDLIFFNSKSSNEVKHVGIYIGNGKFVHNTTRTHQVDYGDLNAPYYSQHFKCARRVTGMNHYASR
jgi:cell wall-associated NlpC family hydrolase